MPIAIPDLQGEGDLGARVAGVIANDLQRSGVFAPIDKKAFIDKVVSPDAMPQFDSWRAINAQALVTGRVQRDSARMHAEFRLWDVASGEQATGQQYTTDANNWRRVAHLIADAIYSKITGAGGFFDTRVVYVDETGPKQARRKRLALMDQDGANVRYLTEGNELVVTPRFSPTSQEVTYMAFAPNGDASVRLLNIETGQREIVGNFPGMTFSPRFSPDGQRVVMSLEQSGNANIYTMDLRSRATTRLTDTTGDRHLTFLFAGRVANRLRERSWRRATALRDGSGRRRGATHLLRARSLFDAGLVAERRLHRLHAPDGQLLRHRRHEAGRLGRAHLDRRLPQ